MSETRLTVVLTDRRETTRQSRSADGTSDVGFVDVRSDSTLAYASARELVAGIATRRFSSREVLLAQLEQVARHNPKLNAVVELAQERGLELARQADAAVARGELAGPLHGIPMTLKDAHSVADMPTTAGLPALRNNHPPRDSAVVRAIRGAGAIIFGRTNVPEGLLDYQTANEIHGRTNNPWDSERTPGGSSGGAAVALATGMTPLEIGSDLAGSLRLPAHFCGVFGLMPTFGTVSNVGHISEPHGRHPGLRLATTVGPMARSLEDLELALSVIAKPGRLDPNALPSPDVKSLRLAFATTFPDAVVSHEIAAAISELAARLERDGASITETLPNVDFREQGRTRTAMVNMLRRASDSEQSAPLPADWLRVREKRREFVRAWDDLLGQVDVLLCPVAMVPAFAHTRTGSELDVDGVPVSYWSLGRYLTPFNLVGAPALAMPLALSRGGLPIGLQVVGARHSDRRLLAVARAIAPYTIGFLRPPS